jgi:hypothetical protein
MHNAPITMPFMHNAPNATQVGPGISGCNTLTASPARCCQPQQRLLLSSGGSFLHDSSGGGWDYQGGQTRLLSVPRSPSLDALLQGLSKGSSSAWDLVSGSLAGDCTAGDCTAGDCTAGDRTAGHAPCVLLVIVLLVIVLLVIVLLVTVLLAMQHV